MVEQWKKIKGFNFYISNKGRVKNKDYKIKKLTKGKNGLRYDYPTTYRKIKYLKGFGFVDWDFKNPNTIANKRKEKINELSSELKELRQFKKDTERYFKLHNKAKLTAQQKEFIAKYLNQFYEEE